MAGPVEDHPVLIPTSQGPAGGIICEPRGRPRASLIFVHGAGRSGRSGFNSQWAVLSRRLAALGVTVLRIDLAGEGDSSTIGEERYPMDNSDPEKIVIDRALLSDAVAWFRQRTEGQGLIVAGSCYGARMSLELAATSPGIIASVLIVPYLWRPDQEYLSRWRERMLRVQRNQPTDDIDRLGNSQERIDPMAVERLEATLGQGPAWVLIGERDVLDVLALEPVVADRGLEIAVEPGVALYPGNSPDIQELVSKRVVARIDRIIESLPEGVS